MRLLMVCKQIAAEATERFYTVNTFVFHPFVWFKGPSPQVSDYYLREVEW